MKRASGESVDPIEGEDPRLRMQLGFLWERACTMVWQGIAWRDALEIVWKEYILIAPVGPPERGEVELQFRLMLDEVAQTPDGFDRKTWRLESYKFTYRSMRKWAEAEGAREIAAHPFWTWLIGEAGYLLSLSKREGRPVLTVRFFIFWANGDYSRKPGRGPQATFTDVTFTWEELLANWANVIKYRDYVIKQREVAA